LTIPLLVTVALSQTVLVSRIDLWGGRPDVMLLVVLVWSMVRGMNEGLVWGLIGGLIIDLISGGPLGATTLSLLVVAFMAGEPWGLGVGAPVIRLLILTFICVIVYHLVLLAVLGWTGYAVDWGWALLRVAAPSALLNAVLAPFVQWPLGWLERRTRQERFVL
jgi:rod shape-determining protein MreD